MRFAEAGAGVVTVATALQTQTCRLLIGLLGRPPQITATARAQGGVQPPYHAPALL